MTIPAFPVPALPSGGHRRAWWRAPASSPALAWAVAGAAGAHAGPLLAVVADNHAAERLENDLRVLLGDDASQPVVLFPDWETLPYDQFSPHPEVVSRRLAALQALPGLRRGVVVVAAATLMQRLPPTRYIAGGSFDVAVGQRLDLDAERLRLQAGGYRLVPQVLDPGDYAVRGGLLDVFPMGADQPYRVELLDDEIDSIRAFDPETQRSLDRVDAVRMLPGREVPLDEDSLQRAMEALR
jgi:transcription-repair coupling factor (superfamily II helicase)